MRLTFQLRFYTRYGQSLFLSGNQERFGEWDAEKAIPLHHLDLGLWGATISLPQTVPDAEIAYNYVLRNVEGPVVQDSGIGHVINPAAFAQEEVVIIDSWNSAGFYENVFYTEPFKEVLLKPSQTEAQLSPPLQATHLFKVKAPLLEKGQTLCLLGDKPSLGNWNTHSPVLLSRKAGEDYFAAELDLRSESFPIAYKYGVYDVERKAFVRFEEGRNRVLHSTASANKLTILNDGFAVLPVTIWKGAGVAIPVFSLRSERSLGVGEFTDLKLLVDWCKQAGLKMIQILPVNDTQAAHTWIDSYPYAAISAFALHPLYLNLSQVAGEKNKDLLIGLDETRKRLNKLDALDYEAVIAAKLDFLKKLYQSQKEETLQSASYWEFFEKNKHWLEPYAAFCYLRDKYKTARFDEWPDHRVYNRAQIAALASAGSEARDEIVFHYFTQFHLHLQLKEATEYAHAHGIILKGDIPIGVSRFGADTWQQPALFHMDMQAGAPPDAFAAKGQNWGFPTYNWMRMKENGYAWWKRRFEQMSSYFDAFRIDHILGFFRIWSIPIHAVEGIMGYFAPALPVRASEFGRRNIWFDHDRYTRPYISERVLQDLFGNDSGLVKSQFLEAGPFGDLRLKPEFATQRQVEHFFAGREQSEQNRRLKQGLYALISNVILFEVEGSRGGQFHFRFGIADTSSFQSLAPETRGQLWDLYIDYFYRRQEDFWMKQGMQKLPALQHVTNMLVCGEDLGMVPACVPEAMKQLGLLSLEVQRMPKALGREFSRPQDAPYLSVVTPSTHDMSTLRGWWEEDRKVTQTFFNSELGEPGEAPLSCEAWISKQIVLQHLHSPAIWSVFQLQDLLGMDEQLRFKDPAAERINVPAIPQYYWRYRMRPTLEKLIQATAFTEELRKSIRESGR